MAKSSGKSTGCAGCFIFCCACLGITGVFMSAALDLRSKQAVEAPVLQAQAPPGLELKTTLDLDGGDGYFLQLSPDGRILMAIGSKTYFFLSNTGEKLSGWSEGGLEIAMSPDEKMVAVADWELRVLSFPEAKILKRAGKSVEDAGVNDPAYDDVAFSPDGSLLAASLDNGMIELYRVRDLSRVRRINCKKELGSNSAPGGVGVNLRLAFLPTGYLAVASNHANVVIYNPTSGEIVKQIASLGPEFDLAVLAVHPSTGAIFAPDGSTYRVWRASENYASGVAVRTDGIGDIISAAFSPYRDSIFLGGYSGLVQEVDLVSGEVLLSWQAHLKDHGTDPFILSLVVNPDKAWLATSAATSELKFWSGEN